MQRQFREFDKSSKVCSYCEITKYNQGDQQTISTVIKIKSIEITFLLDLATLDWIERYGNDLIDLLNLK